MHRDDNGKDPDRAAVRAYEIIGRYVDTEELPRIDLEAGADLAVAAEPTLTHRIGRVAVASAAALIVGELVSLAQTVALARLLSPAEVGMFAAGTVLTMLLTTFVEGGLRSGLVQRDDRVEDAAETVFRASFLNGLAMTLGSLATAPVIGILFHSRTIGMIAAATSGFLLLFSLTNVPEALLQRTFSVRRRIIVGPAVSISFAIVSVVLAVCGFGVWSMVVGTYASYVVWVVSVWWLARWRPGRAHASFRLWRELARFGSPVVVNTMGARAQTLVESAVVGRGLSSAALGHYRYGQRIAQIPVRFIVEVGAVSLFPAFAQIAADGDRDRLEAAYLRALRLTTLGAAALSGLLIVFGEPAVVLVFGARWREAGAVLVAMAGLGLGKAWMSVGEEAIKGAGKTKLLNWQTMVEMVLGIGLLLIGIKFFGLIGVGLATSATALIVGVVVTALARSVIGVRIASLVRAVGPPLPAMAIALFVSWVLERRVLQADTRSIPVGIGLLFIGALAFTVLYVLVLYVLVPDVIIGFIRLAARLGRRLRSNGSPRRAIFFRARLRTSRETN